VGVYLPKGGLNIVITPRPDGGIRVSSDQVPGLVLSGKDPSAVMADVWPALNRILEAR